MSRYTIDSLLRRTSQRSRYKEDVLVSICNNGKATQTTIKAFFTYTFDYRKFCVCMNELDKINLFRSSTFKNDALFAKHFDITIS